MEDGDKLPVLLQQKYTHTPSRALYTSGRTLCRCGRPQHGNIVEGRDCSAVWQSVAIENSARHNKNRLFNMLTLTSSVSIVTSRTPFSRSIPSTRTWRQERRATMPCHAMPIKSVRHVQTRGVLCFEA